MAGQLVSAEAMHQAVRTDPQFTCPVQPTLVRGLVQANLPDGILIEGAPSRQVLRGAATRDLVPAVLPLLDGTLDVTSIAERCGRPRAHVERVIALLYTCGLLEEGAEADTGDWDPQAVMFWSRSLDSTRVNRGTAEVARRLANVRLAVAGDGLLAHAIIADLRANGVAHTEAYGSVCGEGEHDLVIAAIEGDGPEPEKLADTCSRLGVALLPVRLCGDTLELGPYLDPSFTASFADAERQRLADPPPTETSGLSAQVRTRLAAALAVGEIAGVLARIGSIPVLRGLLRIDLGNWSTSLHVISPIPDAVGDQVRTTAAGVPLAVSFENSVAFTPRRLLNPRAHQVHYKPGNLALQHEAKRWPSAPELDLAPWTREVPGGLVLPNNKAVAAEIGLAPLATLLQRTGGLRPDANAGEKVQRWAPTGGNLGSVQLHVVARQVADLPAGTWGYVSDRHRLARLGKATDGGHLGPASAVIVLTAALARVASKYYGFAWRVVHLDAGAAIAQLTYTAQAFGLAARPLSRWDDGYLADLLDLDLDSEPVTGVVLLGAGMDERQ